MDAWMADCPLSAELTNTEWEGLTDLSHQLCTVWKQNSPSKCLNTSNSFVGCHILFNLVEVARRLSMCSKQEMHWRSRLSFKGLQDAKKMVINFRAAIAPSTLRLSELWLLRIYGVTNGIHVASHVWKRVRWRCRRLSSKFKCKASCGLNVEFVHM